ncbi:esterase-like activity of phytase family protein [Aeromicrobium fastidiosum]|uniref:esterase-like activity of phytase family protein n=1 Tax=Aeromicrobium fastidiosum TaxID=52699 RepID=UPI0020234129|nr:esterase-like activity of phytase family protein [Aeromicrobium fastidiosum]MCL8252776.1 esterase-like activity of phytase family protein [Aeromicrobium fastidiosum]
MNPRHRRLLIPGLLLALLVVVLISSVANRSDAAEAGPQTVSTLSDGRINESSGLVVSPDDPDRAYTINDSGGAPVVYAVSISTGRTLGAATIDADLVDTEALSIDPDGTLWIADTGDNRGERTDAALYSLPEIADGTTSVTAERYPVTYPGGSIDVEALAIDPTSGAKYLISKGLFGGTVFRLPDDLAQDRPNQPETLAGDVPGLVTDAAFTPDGRHVVARDYSEAYVLDPVTWQIEASSELPPVDQGETLAMEAGGRSYLIGSEGTASPLIRVPFTPPAAGDASDGPSATPTEATSGRTGTAVPPDGGGFAGATWFWGFVVVALLAAISGAMTTKRR